MRVGLVAVLGGFVTIETASALDWQVAYTNQAVEWYSAIVSSADGKVLVTAGLTDLGSSTTLFISTNGGAGWFSGISPIHPWPLLACSADGVRLAETVSGDVIWISTNLATTWTRCPVPTNVWSSLAMSASGQTLIAGLASGSFLYVSGDGGFHWTSINTPATNGAAVACSADGTKMFAATYLGGISVSTNSGLNWQPTTAPSKSWLCIACSADGSKVMAGTDGYATDSPAEFYLSTNSGASWTSNTLVGFPQELSLLVSSADSSKIAALFTLPGFTEIYVSYDEGLAWTQAGSSDVDWTDLAMSADGGQLAGSVRNTYLEPVWGSVFMSKSIHQPLLRFGAAGGASSLSWTIPSTNFKLQESPNLGATNWTDVPGRPSIVFSNLSYQPTLPSTESQRFFRLKSY